MRTTIKLDFEVERMEPLFATEDDYQAFHDRQSAYRVKTGDLSTYKGKCFLGIDARLYHNKNRAGKRRRNSSLFFLQQ